MLSLHVPSDSDEWLKHETEKLTQFTRLFPLPSTSSRSANADDDGQHTCIDGANKHDEASVDLAEDHESIVEEDDDDDKEDKHAAAAVASQAGGSGGSAAAAMMIRKQQFKSASYEDIIFQVLIVDVAMVARVLYR